LFFVFRWIFAISDNVSYEKCNFTEMFSEKIGKFDISFKGGFVLDWYEPELNHIGSEVLTTESVKSRIFWVITPFSGETWTFRNNISSVFGVEQ
jgi:hypothetical protein